MALNRVVTSIFSKSRSSGGLLPNRLGLRGCGKKTHSSLPGFARNSRCQFLENSFDRGSKHRGKDELDILKMATSITLGIVAIKRVATCWNQTDCTSWFTKQNLIMDTTKTSFQKHF